MFTNPDWVNNYKKIEEDVLKINIKINDTIFKVIEADDNLKLTFKIVTE